MIDSTEPAARAGSARRGGGRHGHGAVYYILLFIACVLVLNALIGEKGLLAMLSARREQAELQQRVEAARQQNAQLRDEIRRLRQDPATIEELARRELGLIKPGEKLFIIRDVSPPDGKAAHPQQPATPRNPASK